MSLTTIEPAKIPVRSTDIVGAEVHNSKGENCGEIVELVIHKRYGEVAYLLLSYPGDFGPEYAEKLFAVPYDAFYMEDLNRTQSHFLLHVDEAFLKAAPGFARNALPDFADPRFVTEHKDYYKGVSLNILT